MFIRVTFHHFLQKYTEKPLWQTCLTKGVLKFDKKALSICSFSTDWLTGQSLSGDRSIAQRFECEKISFVFRF